MKNVVLCGVLGHTCCSPPLPLHQPGGGGSSHDDGALSTLRLLYHTHRIRRHRQTLPTSWSRCSVPGDTASLHLPSTGHLSIHLDEALGAGPLVDLPASNRVTASGFWCRSSRASRFASRMRPRPRPAQPRPWANIRRDRATALAAALSPVTQQDASLDRLGGCFCYQRKRRHLLAGSTASRPAGPEPAGRHGPRTRGKAGCRGSRTHWRRRHLSPPAAGDIGASWIRPRRLPLTSF